MTTSQNSQKRKWSAKSALRVLLLHGVALGPLAAQAAVLPVPVGGVKITDLIQTGIQAIPGCVDYCITGICAHLQFSFPPPKVTVIISPRIAHNTPEFVVSAYRAQMQQPWIEWRRVFGRVQSTLADGVFGLLSGSGQLGGYGTYHEEDDYDKQAPFKEVDINGHPLAFLPSLFSQGNGPNGGQGSQGGQGGQGGQQTSEPDADNQEGQTNSEDEEFGEAESAATDIVNTNGFPAVFMNAEILDIFSYTDTLSQIGQTAGQMSQVMDYFQAMQDALDSFGGAGGVQFSAKEKMCPSSEIPFTPYYLSAADTLSWRVPWADVFMHFLDIGYQLIPFAPDRPVIGTADAMPGLGGGTWGGLYPRFGYVRNSHDGKVGAVVSQRALDLMLAEQGQDQFGHLMLFSPAFPTAPDLHVVPYEFQADGVVGGVWQAVYPVPSYQCSASIYKDKTFADHAIDNSAPRVLTQDQNYVWAFWRRYECCMNRDGVFMAATPITPPICLTPSTQASP